MTTCPTCGAQNDPGNRFCDQCGTRLNSEATATPATPAAGAAVVTPDQPTMAAPTCPNCGSTVLPGEAFCDNCGADLSALSAGSTPAALPTASSGADAPTMIASAPVAPVPAAAGEVQCKVCGAAVLPGERFCDNCGADLTAQPAETAAPVAAPDDATMLASAPASTPVAAPDDATMLAPPPTPADAPTAPATQASVPEPVATAAPEPAAAVAPVPASEPEATPAEATPVPALEATPAAEAAPVPTEAAPTAEAAPAATPASTDVAGERQRLEGLLSAHRDTVAQYEQMAARYPAGSAPAFISAGLDAARAELSRAEADLQALPSGPDPAEVARLEGLIGAHRDTVAQYEQMAARYPAGSAPAFISAGLDAARAELSRAEADLQTLQGGAQSVPAATPAASEAAPAAPEPAAATPSAAPEPAPAAAPAAAPAGTRLVVVDGGQVLSLPADKAEIIVGREDPVSSIFPEVDLTPFGGEMGGVSRQHAKITQSNGQWMITDLNSTNYTRVDGSRLEPNVASPLHDGAKVQFGRVAVTFHL